MHAVDQHPRRARVAVHDRGDVVPLAGGDGAGGGLRALGTTVAGGEQHRSIGMQPQRVGARRRVVRIAFVDQRGPGGVETVDPDPGLDRDGLGQVECGIVRDLCRLQAIEVQCAAECSLAPGFRHADDAVRRDRDRLVLHGAHLERVAGRAVAAVAATFDQQRIGAVVGQGPQLHVVVRQVVRAPHGAAPGVEQAPERITAAGRDHVEIQPFAGAGAELVGIGFGGRREFAGDDGIAFERDRVAQVEQPETVVARGVAAAVDPQGVVAGDQVEHAQAVLRVALLERTVRHHGAARAAEVPAQVVVVGQRVEIQARVVGQREPVVVGLAVVDAAGHHASGVGPHVDQRGVVAAAGRVGQRGARAVVRLQVQHQAVFVAGERLVLVVGDLLRAAHRVPQPDVVDLAQEVRVAFGGTADEQGVVVGARGRRVQCAAGRFDTVDVDLHLPGVAVAVEYRRDVVPAIRGDGSGGGADGVVRVVAAGQVQVAVVVQPQGVGALVAVAIALVEQRLPGAGIGVDLEPGFQRQRSGLVDVVAVGHLGMAQAVEVQRLAQRPRPEVLHQAIRFAGHDVGEVVGDLEQPEVVVDRRYVLGFPDPAFDDQRVAPILRHGEQVDVVEMQRPEHLVAQRVEQAPAEAIGADAQALLVEVIPRAGGRVEGVDGGRVGRVECALDRRVAVEVGGVGDVEQAEAEGAGLRVRGVECQRVVARDQVEQGTGAAQFMGLGAIEAPAADLGAARAAQRPVDVRVGIVRCQRVEQQLARLGQAEPVDGALTRLLESAADGLAHG